MAGVTDKRIYFGVMNICFQYYGSIASDIKAKGVVTFEQFIELQMSANSKLLFEQIALAEHSGDIQLKAKLKQNNLRPDDIEGYIFLLPIL